MWPWIKRWRDWAMTDLLPLYRLGPQSQALAHSYEKAGLTLHGQPIPWNAEAVLVEATLGLRESARRKADYSLRLAGREPLPADSLRRGDAVDRYHLFFRFPTPPAGTTAELLYRGRVLGRLDLPVLDAAEFQRNLRLQLPTMTVRVGDQSVACQTFVATQCKGVFASALLVSPTSLAPLVDLGLRVEFRSERDGKAFDVAVPLCSSQLAGRQALVAAALPAVPRRIGTWSATWRVGDAVLATQKVRAISLAAFQKSLRVSDTRFVVETPKDGVSLRRQAPPPGEATRVGPCFLVSSREPGMAGLATLQVLAQVPGAVRPPLLQEQQVLVTDGPTIFAPGTLDAADLTQVTTFELRQRTEVLGVLSLCPVPTATFTGEGGFKPPPEFTWTPTADDELSERLSRLLDGPRG
ncbi:MAG: hypothetical protein U0746_10105 [Gemmataceae bacterium]